VALVAPAVQVALAGLADRSSSGIPGGGGGGSIGAGGANCLGNSAQALALFEGTSMNGWNRANAIEIVPVSLCPDARRQVIGALRSDARSGALQAAVSNDDLVRAALSRTSYGADRVLAVNRSGGRLTVFVF
jgi:hypothetical protein